MLVFISVSIVLLACSDGGNDSGEGPGEGSAEDLIQVAYGQCTHDYTLRDADGAAVVVETGTYNADGDPVLLDGSSIRDDGLHYVTETTYGNPHEYAQASTRWPKGALDDWSYTGTWADGDLVKEEYDELVDGSVDSATSWQYDDHRPTRQEWDYNGDGTSDDWLVLTWTKVDGGWDVSGEGEDANGPYSVMEHWDDALNLVSYSGADSTGLEIEWAVSAFNDLGLADDSWERLWYEDSLIRERINERDFDERGRAIRDLETTTSYDDGDITDVDVDDEGWVYSCP